MNSWSQILIQFALPAKVRPHHPGCLFVAELALLKESLAPNLLDPCRSQMSTVRSARKTLVSGDESRNELVLSGARCYGMEHPQTASSHLMMQ